MLSFFFLPAITSIALLRLALYSLLHLSQGSRVSQWYKWYILQTTYILRIYREPQKIFYSHCHLEKVKCISRYHNPWYQIILQHHCNMHPYVHYSFIYNKQDIGATEVSNKRQVDTKEWNFAICDNTARPREYC